MRTVRDNRMYRASGMNEYEKSGKMPKELIDYLEKKYRRGGMVYAQESSGVPRYFSPQATFSMQDDRQLAELEGLGREDDAIQRMVDRALASKADRDDKVYTRDFNPRPVKDFIEPTYESFRQEIKKSPLFAAADKYGADKILKLRGEYVEQTPETEREMWSSRDSGEDSGWVTASDFSDYVRENYMDRPGMAAGDLFNTETGFTTEEFGAKRTPGAVSFPRESLSRGAQQKRFAQEQLNEMLNRLGNIYGDRSFGDAAFGRGKQ